MTSALQSYSICSLAQELLSRKQAQEHLARYIEFIDYGISPARHHQFLISKLEAIQKGETKRLMVFMPPGSAKSTYGSILFPAWYFGNSPTQSVIASSHTTELAERFGRRVRNLLLDPRHQKVFPGCVLSPDSQAAGRWALTAGGEYYAAGVGSAILGFRADLGIIDDPVAGREVADSDRERDKIWDWYKNDFYTRLKPGASVVLIMQRWHEDDLAGRLLRDSDKGGEKWEIIKLPMIANDGDQLGRSPGEMLWPEWYKTEMVAQVKRDERSFLALYQQEPRPESGGEFKKEWRNHYTIKPSHGMNIYIIVDPASEKKKTSDYTAVWVLGLGHDQNIYALDIYRDKLNLTERADLVLKLHRQYKPVKVGYEKYGMQSDIEHLKDRMEREQYRFAITELGGTLRKEDRIRRLIPLFEANRIWLPASLHRTNYQKVVTNVVEEFFEEEYLPFPVGLHDDLMDCLARIEDPLLGAVFPKERKVEKVRDLTGVSNGWMAA